MEEEEKKKLKDENEVMAKIAYKVWKEKKTEEWRPWCVVKSRDGSILTELLYCFRDEVNPYV